MTPRELAAELRRLEARAEQLKQRDGYTVMSTAWRNAVEDIGEALQRNLPTILAALESALAPTLAERYFERVVENLDNLRAACVGVLDEDDAAMDDARIILAEIERSRS